MQSARSGSAALGLPAALPGTAARLALLHGVAGDLGDAADGADQAGRLERQEEGLLVGRVGELAERIDVALRDEVVHRSEEHTSELQSLMRISYAVFCLKKKK